VSGNGNEPDPRISALRELLGDALVEVVRAELAPLATEVAELRAELAELHDPLWTVQRSARFLDMTTQAVRDAQDAGRLPRVHLGGKRDNAPVRIPRSAVLAFGVLDDGRGAP
jgi:hypothetical protein